MIAVSGITGCCQGRNFHRVGGTHGVPNYPNQDAFDRALYSKYPLYINIVVTNFDQFRAREYLAVGGWKTEKVGMLWISTISHTDFNRYKTSLQIKWREEELKKREAIAVHREALPKNTKKKITLKEILDITARDDTRRYRTGYSYVEFNDVIRTVNKKYGINIPINRETRNWSYHSLHNSVVRRVYNKNK